MLPLAVYFGLLTCGVAPVWALVGAASASLVVLVATSLRTQEITVLGVLVLVRFGVGIAVAVVAGDPRLELAKDLATTAVIGVVMAVSLGWRRPSIARIRRDLSGSPDAFDRRFDHSEGFRVLHRRLTLLWAVVLLAEASLGIVAVYTLPLTLAVVSTTILGPAAILGLIGVTQFVGGRANGAAALRETDVVIVGAGLVGGGVAGRPCR
ncbi:hypothetical protein P3102_22070 [Amycolatopsis sp. QT-25]|nr:VC0807 family protein [Amycolatopsis sp. QT-25]WET76794.1 hypothetical protein P3102_22070 [Amycolatopsis sp. QT-25]